MGAFPIGIWPWLVGAYPSLEEPTLPFRPTLPFSSLPSRSLTLPYRSFPNPIEASPTLYEPPLPYRSLPCPSGAYPSLQEPPPLYRSFPIPHRSLP